MFFLYFLAINSEIDMLSSRFIDSYSDNEETGFGSGVWDDAVECSSWG